MDAKDRILEWLDARAALGHKADVIGMIRGDGDERALLRASDLRALCEIAADAQDSRSVFEKLGDA